MKFDFFYNFLLNIKIAFTGDNDSLNYRAKLFACMIAACNAANCEHFDTILQNLSSQIYKNSLRKQLFLASIRFNLAYIKNKTLGLDNMLVRIKKIAKINPKLKRAIKFSELEQLVLKRTISEFESEIIDYSQIRVLEFLKNEVI